MRDADATDPFALFQAWFGEAEAHPHIAHAHAACLATADARGVPSARMVLLKDCGEDGFVFYTNLASRKSRELTENPNAALCLYWGPLARQVRVLGGVTRVTQEEADAYFATRPREAQIGAWASLQSQALAGREELEARVLAYEAQCMGGDVPRPPHWSGWRMAPEEIEFWREGPFRLHTRILFTRRDGTWEKTLLYP